MIWLAIGLVLVAGLLAYWFLVVTEGTYLGPRVVTLLYDWTARRYDTIKKLHFVNETYFLGLPLERALAAWDEPVVLDVATGTARLPLALAAQGAWHGRLVGLDRSRRMMREARRALRRQGLPLPMVQGDAGALPFPDESFHAVTCLEALEFVTKPEDALEEMVRVLVPDGVLLLSNRVGKDARCFPGRMAGRGKLEKALGRLALADIRSERWQVHYDLIWARKASLQDRQSR